MRFFKNVMPYLLIFLVSCVYFQGVYFPLEKEEMLGDVYHTVDEISFNEVTTEGKKIVLFDNRGLDNIKYYVFVFSGNEYVLYAYNYMNTHYEYLDMYRSLVGEIVDYNYDEYMIQSVSGYGEGTFDDILKEIHPYVENEEVYIIY